MRLSAVRSVRKKIVNVFSAITFQNIKLGKRGQRSVSQAYTKRAVCKKNERIKIHIICILWRYTCRFYRRATVYAKKSAVYAKPIDFFNILGYNSFVNSRRAYDNCDNLHYVCRHHHHHPPLQTFSPNKRGKRQACRFFRFMTCFALFPIAAKGETALYIVAQKIQTHFRNEKSARRPFRAQFISLPFALPNLPFTSGSHQIRSRRDPHAPRGGFDMRRFLKNFRSSAPLTR